MDCGWDTSDDEGGMQIDLGDELEEQLEKSDDVLENDQSHGCDLPTDDCEQSEPSKDSDVESSKMEQPINNNSRSITVMALNHTGDPGDPSHSGKEEDSDTNSREEGCPLQTKTVKNEISDDESNVRLSSPVLHTQEKMSSRHDGENTCSELQSFVNSNNSESQNINIEQVEMTVEGQNCNSNDSLKAAESPLSTQKHGSQSLTPLDTDDNTQNSILSDVDVSGASSVENEFVLEKESFKKDNEQQADVFQQSEEMTPNKELEMNDSSPSYCGEIHEEEREKFRRQQEVDTRNEEVLVDLFREEAYSEGIEEDVSRAVKKSKRKVVSKKGKKKGKKLKKSHSKRTSKKVHEDVEDHRFVEIRSDRLSVEGNDDGELEGGTSVLGYRKSFDEKVSVDIYEQVLDEKASNHLEDEQLEPGEIVEVVKRKRKKKDKRKKRKRRRRVATVEEGNEGDDSHKFPTFLDGFFVQDEEGEEELEEEQLENVSYSLENKRGRTFQKGNKIYRRHHSSESEDSHKSFEQNVNISESLDFRSVESEHERSRKRVEREHHETRDRRQRDIINTHEVRYATEHHHGTPRNDWVGERYDRERSWGERDRERLRNRERERDRGREVICVRDRRRVEVDERRQRFARSSSHDRSHRWAVSQREHREKSQDHSIRLRHRSKSREWSGARERNRERSKHNHHNRSHERESNRRVRPPSPFRSRSPRHRPEKTGSDKENREESYRTRHRRGQEATDIDDRGSGQRRIRREGRERERSKSSSSSSSSSTSSSSSSTSNDGDVRQRRIGRHHDYVSLYISDDDDDSSDVIVLETERVVINLDDDDDEAPSRMVINRTKANSKTQLIAKDVSAKNVVNSNTQIIAKDVSTKDVVNSNTQIIAKEVRTKNIVNSNTQIIAKDFSTKNVVNSNTQIIAKDFSTKNVVSESVTSSKQSKNSKGIVETQISPHVPEVQIVIDTVGEQDGDTTPTRDEFITKCLQSPQSSNSAQESDYDPAHPTEETEDFEIRSPEPKSDASPLPPPEPGPVPPDHPPPQEMRPSPPPGPSLVEKSNLISQLQHLPVLGAPRSPLSFGSPFQQQPPPPLLQHQSSLHHFQGGPNAGLGQSLTFPSRPLVNGPGSNILPQNSSLPSIFPPSQRGLLPTPETRSLLLENSRIPPPFASSLPHFPRPPPPPIECLPQQRNIAQPQMPIANMAPLAQLTRLLPSLEATAKTPDRNDQGICQPSQMFRYPPPMVSLQASLMDKSPLMRNSTPIVSSYTIRSSQGRFGNDILESNEVVDMDMSPRGEDSMFGQLSPISTDSDSDNDELIGQSQMMQATSLFDSSKSGSAIEKSLTQPAIHNKSSSKDADKLTPKGHPNTSNLSHKSKSQPGRRKKLEINDDDIPTSAVDLTNKEKYMKKLHFQERVIDEVKLAIKPFYNSKKISKEQYKAILRKAVPKVCHSKSGHINPQKIQHLVEAYVRKIIRSRGVGSGNKKKKQRPESPKDTASVPVWQNGERAKNATR